MISVGGTMLAVVRRIEATIAGVAHGLPLMPILLIGERSDITRCIPGWQRGITHGRKAAEGARFL